MFGMFVFGAAIAYAAALGLELTAFKSGRIGTVLRNALTATGGLLLTVYLIEEHPRLSSPAKFFFAAAWCLNAAELLLQYFRAKMSAGTVLLPLTLLFLTAAYLLTGDSAAPPSSYRSLILLHSHTILLLSATVGICVSFFAALMYLFQDVRLRYKQLPPKTVNLPTLEWSLAVCRWSLSCALVLFFGGVFAGIHLTAIQKTKLPQLSWQDPLLLGSAVLMPLLLLWLVFFPKSNGRLLSWSAVAVFLCLLAVLTSALFLKIAHWNLC